ncbi:MAG: twin-arginine translocation signal domain-containing protein, partial [Actinoplanes sp.]
MTHIDRRNVLKGAAATAVATAVGPAGAAPAAAAGGGRPPSTADRAR